MLLDFFVAGGIAAAAATKGLSDRPLETFGRTPMSLDFYRSKRNECGRDRKCFRGGKWRKI